MGLHGTNKVSTVGFQSVTHNLRKLMRNGKGGCHVVLKGGDTGQNRREVKGLEPRFDLILPFLRTTTEPYHFR